MTLRWPHTHIHYNQSNNGFSPLGVKKGKKICILEISSVEGIQKYNYYSFLKIFLT